ncbi:MAG: sulfotransferase domain-containing protein [Chloroflexi bacterium]|nr:sulfotransferase domain-containing protein [Chloroflexota bacterium]
MHLRDHRLARFAALGWLHIHANPSWPLHIIQRRMNASRLVVVIGSAHRVGSTWLFEILRDLGCLRNAINEAPPHLHRFGALWPGSIDYYWVARIHGWAILKGHADPPTTEDQAALARFVTIYRDPRDVVVSSSFQRARLPQAQGGLGEEFRSLSPAERINRLLLSRNPTLLVELERWFRTPYAVQIVYEALRAQPQATVTRLAEELGLPVNQRQVAAVVTRRDFARTTGRIPGQEADAAARKGIVGDWRNYFTSDTVECFKTAQDGRWNALLVEMGYETQDDW